MLLSRARGNTETLEAPEGVLLGARRIALRSRDKCTSGKYEVELALSHHGAQPCGKQRGNEVSFTVGRSVTQQANRELWMRSALGTVWRWYCSR
jgi:hypothetical protein